MIYDRVEIYDNFTLESFETTCEQLYKMLDKLNQEIVKKHELSYRDYYTILSKYTKVFDIIFEKPWSKMFLDKACWTLEGGCFRAKHIYGMKQNQLIIYQDYFSKFKES